MEKDEGIMKIERLKPQFCQQGISYEGVCGEVAYYRISTDSQSLSVAYCEDHAMKFLAGKSTLEPIKCTQCGSICKPGYLRNKNNDNPFCYEACMAAWDGSANSAAYR